MEGWMDRRMAGMPCAIHCASWTARPGSLQGPNKGGTILAPSSPPGPPFGSQVGLLGGLWPSKLASLAAWASKFASWRVLGPPNWPPRSDFGLQVGTRPGQDSGGICLLRLPGASWRDSFGFVSLLASFWTHFGSIWVWISQLFLRILE